MSNAPDLESKLVLKDSSEILSCFLKLVSLSENTSVWHAAFLPDTEKKQNLKRLQRAMHKSTLQKP